MKAHYTRACDKYCHQIEILITLEHHFRADIFIAAIDFQLQKLNIEFYNQIVELLNLSLALYLHDSYNSFNVYD